MSDAYQRLLARLPARAAAGAGAGTGIFPSEPRALRAWINALPMASFGSASPKLLDGVTRLNTQRVDGLQRLEALEMLREPLLQLALSAERQIVGASFPLPPQKRSLGDVALGFQRELALGYCIALADICAPAGSVGFMRGKHVALAAVRALQHGGEHLARAYLIYRTPPIGAWQALHDVYRFVKAVELDDRAVEDALQKSSSTARTAYRQAVLFALTNPYRFSQREQGDVAALVRALAPHAPLRSNDASRHAIRLRTDVDRGPGYIADERDESASETLTLAVEPAQAFADEQLAKSSGSERPVSFRIAGAVPVSVGAALARRAIDGIGVSAERSHDRRVGGYWVDIVMGLADLHQALADGDGFDEFVTRSANRGTTQKAAVATASPLLPAGEVRYARVAARVIDQSLGGYRLLIDSAAGATAARIRVAELVGIALHDIDLGVSGDWMPGVVRWLRIDDNGRADVGIQLLARRALPVAIRATGDSQGQALRGIAVASMAGSDEARYAGFITSTEIERCERDITLTYPIDGSGMPSDARVETVADPALIEATGVFRRYALPQGAAATAGMEIA